MEEDDEMKYDEWRRAVKEAGLKKEAFARILDDWKEEREFFLDTIRNIRSELNSLAFRLKNM